MAAITLIDGATAIQTLEVAEYTKITIIVRTGGTDLVVDVGPTTAGLTTILTLSPGTITTLIHAIIEIRLTPTGTTFDVIASPIA